MVTFNNIPAAGTIRNPFMYVEVDPSGAASPSAEVNPTLIVGELLAAGTAADGDLLKVDSVSQARSLFGEGSYLAEAVAAFRDNDAFSELWCLAFADSAGTALVTTVTIVGTATADGTIELYINGQKVTTDVTSGDTATNMATNMAAAVTAATDMPVTAASALGVVTLTSRHAAEFTNQIDIRANYLGQAGGEVLPAGVTSVTVAVGTPGAGNQDLSSAGPGSVGMAALLGDSAFDAIIHPYTDATNLANFESLLNDTTGRWAWNVQIYGHAFTGKFDTAGNLTTLGTARNSGHQTIIGLEDYCAADYQVVAAAVARSAQSLANDPARPLQTLDLLGILPADKASRLTASQRNTLLFDGIATLYTDSAGTVRIERMITTFQTDSFGSASDALLDVNTLFTLMRVQRYWKAGITSRWPRYKLADDDTPIAEGQKIVTPKIVKGGIIADYAAMMQLGWVENLNAFASSIIVTRPAGDPNRLDMVVEPDLINQFRVLAVANRFRLQTPATAV